MVYEIIRLTIIRRNVELLLSIVVPTFNEKYNIRKLSGLINESMGDLPYEIIFVDDSTDDTPDVLKQASDEDEHIRYEHRTDERGLAAAVIRGFQLAEGDVIAVMDADLQHPPSLLPLMLSQIEAGADIVIPSRFIPGGSDGGLSLSRKIISGVARYMARALLKRVRSISDPTSGLFMFKREVIQGVALKPIGWKILIEILARGKFETVTEIPYAFQARSAGASKMSVREQWNYVKHLLLLMKDSPSDRRLFTFLLVGLSGVIVNMAVYVVMVHIGTAVWLSGLVSALVALLTNFILNDRVTWGDIRKGNWHIRAIKYIAVSLAGIALDISILDVLFSEFHANYALANIAGIITASAWNFTVNNLWTWKRNKKTSTAYIGIAQRNRGQL